MAEFVLVAGAWLGAWAWDDVVPHLRAAGHGVHPVTLSGVAERSGEPAGQETHVRDIVAVVERTDLREVVVAGHSYSGIPAGQAADRIGDRLKRVVFVDSNVPADGESFASAWWQGREAFEALLVDGDWPVPPAAEFAGQELPDEQIARFVARGTPHPGRSLTEPASLSRPLGELPATYVKCLLDGEVPSPDVVELLKSASWELVELDTGHWPMFSRPRELAEILLAAAS